MMEPVVGLRVPDASAAGPSQSARSATSARPASTQVYTSVPQHVPQHNASQSSRKRASHQVTSQQDRDREREREEQAAVAMGNSSSSGFRDVYAHPAAVAYAAAHPRRTIPKFGPYLLLQTLGEGEFGKVKLGLHSQWGEEVAVKLIRRGNIDTAVRMSKVEREIEVLRTIKHPNIVRLYDVIETDKYIGIILEYASGGELFDHILAHRYLKEKDACKLFAQLISGVWYIHQKKIVHRDLKLENLLLDRHRNVIITDFGFANRFEHRTDDLMQTSCGSPCYAAPELVISEGLYVGSAVDIWSCGVILYAMLAGYLPFDDDPANPDGDNINLLYKYIVNTPLTFPDYVSQDARDLLGLMLVPDPKLRADLNAIMGHHWLKPYAHLFERDVQDLERLAMEQHQMKRLAYQRQMKQQAAAAAADQQKIQRSQSARMEIPQQNGAQVHGHRPGREHPPSAMNEDYLYEANADESLFSSPALPQVKRGHTSAIVTSSTASAYNDDPFGPPGNLAVNTTDENGEMRTRKGSTPTSRSSRKQVPPEGAIPAKTSPERRKSERQRHTIQLEYGGDEQDARHVQGSTRSKGKRKEVPVETVFADEMAVDGQELQISDAIVPDETMLTPVTASRLAALQKEGNKPLPSAPNGDSIGYSGAIAITTSEDSREGIEPPSDESSFQQPPTFAITPTSPPRNEYPPSSFDRASLVEKEKEIRERDASIKSNGSGSGSTKSRHRKGMSVDKIVGKLWGSGAENDGISVKARRMPSDGVGTPARTPPASQRPSTISMSGSNKSSMASPDSKASATDAVKKEEKKSRRNTLTVMVEPLTKRMSQRAKSRATSGEANAQQPSTQAATAPVINGRAKEKPIVPPVVMPSARGRDPRIPETPRFDSQGRYIPASTSKSSKVMQWFRQRSKSRATSPANDEEDRAPTPTAGIQRAPFPSPQSQNQDQKAGPDAIAETLQALTMKSPAPPTSTATAPPMGRSASSQTTELPTPVSATPQQAHKSFRRTMNRLSSMVGGAPPQISRPGYNRNAIRVHHGAFDNKMVTTGPPPEVMAKVTKVLLDMGLEVQQESEYKYRCIRAKRKKAHSGTATPGGLTAYTMIGSAASNGIDKRGLPVPSQTSFGNTGGMLKGLLMRRQSSHISPSPSTETADAPAVMGSGSGESSLRDGSSREKLAMLPAPPSQEPIYGGRAEDMGDEVRFSVELTRIDGLEDTFSIDIRRLKGHLRSYKFVYDGLRERIDFTQEHRGNVE